MHGENCPAAEGGADNCRWQRAVPGAQKRGSGDCRTRAYGWHRSWFQQPDQAPVVLASLEASVLPYGPMRNVSDDFL